jgi:hypothetical protein
MCGLYLFLVPPGDGQETGVPAECRIVVWSAGEFDALNNHLSSVAGKINLSQCDQETVSILKQNIFKK